ncbi:MAG: MBL fold metallo-hydrolase [Culicoidibacterales bacterium]
MEIIILGNRAGLAPYKADSTAYALQNGQTWWLFDASPQILQQINQHKLKLSRLSHIYISHDHQDHCGGLFSLLSVSLLNRETPLMLYVPPTLVPLVELFLATTSKQVANYLVIQPLIDGKTYTFDQCQVEVTALRHEIPSYACIIETPATMQLAIDLLQADGIPKMEWAQYRNYTGEPNRYLQSNAGNRIGLIFDTEQLPNSKQWRQLTWCCSEATFLQADADYARAYHHVTTKQANEFYQTMQPKQYVVSHLSRRYTLSDFAQELTEGIEVAEIGQKYRF